MQIVELNSEFNITVPFNHYTKRNLAMVKELPERRWNPNKKVWRVPIAHRDLVNELAKRCRAEVIKVDNSQRIEIGELPELPELDLELPLSHPKGFQLREYQGKGVARGMQLKRFINGDEQGLGKAQPVYSKIATPQGWKTFGDIKIGDLVFGLDGKTQKVTGVFPQSENETYRVHFNDGFHVDCNLEHLWIVRDQNRRRRGKGWTNKTLKELLEQGIEYKSNPKRVAYGAKPILKWELPSISPVEYQNKHFIIHPYIMGCLLGDGCMTGKTPCISIPDHQMEIKNRIESLLPDNLKVYINRHPDCPQYYITQTGTTKANPFQKEIKRLGINVHSKDKFVPIEYLQASVEQRKELLMGLMDTDGSARRNRITYHTMSSGLVDGISELVQSLGGLVRVREYDRGEKGLEYQVSIKSDFFPFTLTDKLNQCWKRKRKFTSRYISKVEKVGKHEHVCISVSNKDCIYLTNHYVPTHNTIQSISTLLALSLKGYDVFPTLVICPAAMKTTWEREFEEWTDLKAMILDNSNKTTWPNFHQMGVADAFITNFESLKKFFVEYMPPKGKLRRSDQIKMNPNINLFKSIIVDESHRCKDIKTQQSKLVLRIAHGKEYVILLTGTSVVNKPIDLFPQLAILGRHNQFGGRKGFLARYCEGGSGAANLKELNYLINKYCFFRREKKDVAKDLPDKQRQTILCDITTRKEYNKAFHEFEQYLKESGCSDKEIAKKMRGEIMVKMGELKRISALGKLNEVKEFIREVNDSGEKLIVFCVLHSIVDELLREFPKAVTVTGRDNSQKKQEAIDAFQNDDDTKLIICNIKAAGVGITLTASSRVAFVEYPWTYADCVQCEDRAHRIGQKNNVMCTYFLGNNTVDEDLYKMIQEKRHVANTITGATDTMEMSFVDNMMGLFNIKD